MVGNGCQLGCVVMLVIVIATCTKMYTDNGMVTKTWILSYILTSFVNGFVSGGLFRQFSRNSKSDLLKRGWKRAMLLSAALLPMVTAAIGLMMNSVAVYFGTMNTLNFTTMVTLVASWLFVIVPLNVGGTVCDVGSVSLSLFLSLSLSVYIQTNTHTHNTLTQVLGRNLCGKPQFPCRVNTLPRHDIPVNWYLRPTFMMLATGVLPFGSIFIEMYFIFSSFWSYKVYYVYGFMFLVYVILTLVTLCCTVVSTYALLNSENWRWIWFSFLSSGSTAIYVFLYSVYYFHFKTNMNGVIQTSFYFGYTTMFCFAFFLFSGSVGFLGSFSFVKRIYRSIKTD